MINGHFEDEKLQDANTHTIQYKLIEGQGRDVHHLYSAGFATGFTQFVKHTQGRAAPAGIGGT